MHYGVSWQERRRRSCGSGRALKSLLWKLLSAAVASAIAFRSSAACCPHSSAGMEAASTGPAGILAELLLGRIETLYHCNAAAKHAAHCSLAGAASARARRALAGRLVRREKREEVGLQCEFE